MEKHMTGLKKWLILINVSISVFMATLDGSIVNIALPVISNELKVNISSIQWVVTSYLLAISVLLLVWGKISDIYGKKKIFAFGFIIFTVGSALCGLSPQLNLLVASRVIQAIGASAMMALSQGIVTSVFPPNERGKALGITGTTVAIGSLVGPSLGGVLVHIAGWESIFFINVPIGILGTVLTFLIIPELHEAQDSKAFDFKGAGTLIASILLLFLGLLFLQEGELPFWIFAIMFAAAVFFLVAFIVIERKISNPLLKLELFKIHEFSFGIGSAYLSFVAINATVLFIPFYLQFALGLNTLTAGLLISFYPITTAILAPISGWLSDRITYRPLTVTGLCINTLVLFILATFNLSTPHFEIAVVMVFLGAGVAIFQSPNNSSIMGSVPRNQLGVAGGINALFRNLGMVSGTTLSVMIFSFTAGMNINTLTGSGDSTTVDLFLKGYRVVLIFAGAACFLSALLSLTRAVGIKPGKDGSPPPAPQPDV